MGDVYRALDTSLGRDIALKILPSDAARDPDRRRRFENEARSIASLHHPNIVTIHSVEEIGGTHFLTMELVEGSVLSDLVPAGGMSRGRFLAVAIPLAEAVACAHAKGIAHRDLKPANVMVDPDGRLKVLDFGLAKLWAGESKDPERTVDASYAQTGTDRVVGTPAYMAPEQISGAPVDARSDVFSLGILFHELLAGSHPFAAGYAAATMVRIVDEEAPPLTNVPEALAGIVARCLRKDPSERFVDAGELFAVLRALPEDTSGVTSDSVPVVSSPCEIRAALDRSEWQEAYDSLIARSGERSLEPEELEMMAEATVWLSRYEESIDALERAHARYSEAGRARDAGRVALDLVGLFVELRKPAIVRGWMRRAERLLRELPECLEQGLLLRRQTVDELGAGDLERALELNRQCAGIAERLDDADLQAVALHDRGQIRIAGGEVEEGTALLDEAMASAMSGDVGPMTLGSLFCRTLVVCRTLADFERAREWTEAATRWGDRHATSSFPGICRVHSAETMRHHGQWKEAEQAVRGACDLFDRVGPDSHAGEAFLELGELALRKGDYEEAEAAFERAHEFACDPVPGLPLLRLAQGKGPAALQMIRRALGNQPENRLRRARLLAAHITIAMACGEIGDAELAARELSAISADFHCPAFRAHAALGRGMLALERGDAAGASSELHDAWSVFHEAGFAYDAARARVLLAGAYRESGDEEDARLQLAAARKTFSELGARPDLEAVSDLIDGASAR